MAIDALVLTDFQPWANLRLRLDPAVTTLVGPTDVGKSSVLRALRWLALNRPLGSGIVRRGAATAGVAARVDGRVAVRRRGAGTNGYALDGRPFAAVGSDVPPEVTELLRLTSDNFQGQHDAPYWFGLSPGRLAQELNRLVDLELIDQVLGRLGAGRRKAAQAVEFRAQRLAEAEAQAKGLAWVPAASRALAALQTRAERLADLQQQVIALRSIIEAGRGLEAQAGRAAPPNMTDLEQRVTKLERLRATRDGLATLVIEARHLVAQVRDVLKPAAEHATRELEAWATGRCPLCGRE